MVNEVKNHPDALSSNITLHSDLFVGNIQKQRTTQSDIDISGKTIVGHLMQLQSSMHQALTAALSPCDLTYYEYGVLAALRTVGEPWALSPSTLKDKLLFTSGGLSNLLKRLEKQHFITRKSNPRDGRGVFVYLTPHGRQIVDEAIPRVAATELHLVRKLNARDRTALVRLLQRMRAENGPNNF